MARQGASCEEACLERCAFLMAGSVMKPADEFVNAEGLPPDISRKTLHCGKLPVAHQEGPREKRCLKMFWCLRKCVVNKKDSLLNI